MSLHPIVLSLQVAGVASALALVVGLPVAWLLARRGVPGRNVLTVLILLPMVLPPTVLGYYLLVIIGVEGPVGQMAEALGVGRIVFTPTAAVLAAFAASVPFLIVAARAGFEQVDPAYEEAARTLGRSELAIAALVTLPLAWRSVAAGLALTFARAVGEFGATIMVAGSVPGRTRTASIAIYEAVQMSRMDEANLMALLLTVITAGMLLALVGLGRGGSW